MMGRRRRSVLLVPDSRTESAARPDGGADALAPFDPGERGEWWWRQPKWSRQEWVFEASGRVVAAMRGEPLFSFSRTARVRFADAVYEVRHGWKGGFELRSEGAHEPVARFVPRWSGGGRLETLAGEALKFVPTGFWRRAHDVRTDDERVLLRCESHDGFLRHHVQVHVEEAARRRSDLPLLLALSAAILFAPKRHSYTH